MNNAAECIAGRKHNFFKQDLEGANNIELH